MLLTTLLASCGGGGGSDIRDAASRRAGPAIAAFGDHDAYPWQGVTPAHYPVHGIDVSRWQGHIDWRQARQSGIEFAFIKATEGGDVADPMFADHWASARRAGVRRGAYHFYYFCRTAAEQAMWFIRNVPRDSTALPHVLDLEWNHASKTCPYKPDPATIRAEARTFLDILERHYGKRPIIYTTPDFYRDTGIGGLRGTEFWVRSVAGHPSDVYPGFGWTFWQYTGTGSVPGVSGPVDINVFRGAPRAWRRWG